MSQPGIQTEEVYLDLFDPEDSIQDFEFLLGFRCKAVVHAWEWKKNGNGTEAFLGSAPNFLEVLRTAEKLKGSQAPVLITGESGTGKDLMAHFIHQLENNADRPFVAVNCGAIPDNLIESELFGHEKGAFTGATERKIGFFEKADGGDIFLDEISALKPEMQVKLLRVLQNKKINRVGGKEPIHLNFRVIAASNENLGALLHDGKFRLDLFHRLAVVPLQMPPLRERLEDIPALASYFMKKYTGGRPPVSISNGGIEFLKHYPWPGNIRQLENCIHRITLLHSGTRVTEKELSLAMQNGIYANGHSEKHCGTCDCRQASETPEAPAVSPAPAALKDRSEEMEKEAIRHALEKSSGNISKAAKELQISRTTLYRKITLYGLSKN